jgi:hypothetical protein
MMPPERKIVADKQGCRRCDARSNQIEPHEDEGDHRGGEDLEEPFHPQVNDPPSPVFDHRQVGVLSPRQSCSVEQGNCSRGHGQQSDQLPCLAGFRKAGSSTRIIRNSQSSSPTIRPICQTLPRSTYSYP